MTWGSASRAGSPELTGKRILLRPLVVGDFEAWREVRIRARDWLVKWEPRSAHATSLAEDQGSHAVCIVLSGAGSDGASMSKYLS